MFLCKQIKPREIFIKGLHIFSSLNSDKKLSKGSIWMNQKFGKCVIARNYCSLSRFSTINRIEGFESKQGFPRSIGSKNHISFNFARERLHKEKRWKKIIHPCIAQEDKLGNVVHTCHVRVGTFLFTWVALFSDPNISFKGLNIYI